MCIRDRGSVSIRVRGISTVNAGSDPLYIIDGVPVERRPELSVQYGRDQCRDEKCFALLRLAFHGLDVAFGEHPDSIDS